MVSKITVAGVRYINYGKLWRHTLCMIFWSLKHLFFLENLAKGTLFLGKARMGLIRLCL